MAKDVSTNQKEEIHFKSTIMNLNDLTIKENEYFDIVDSYTATKSTIRDGETHSIYTKKFNIAYKQTGDFIFNASCLGDFSSYYKDSIDITVE